MFISAFVYYYIGYPLVRTDVTILITLYSVVFLSFFGLIRLEKQHFFTLAGIAIVFRLVFLGSIPNLSQDFYRFIWDGRMLVEGWNPYLYLPNDLMASGTAPIAEAQELFNGMGDLSASHYTNYPPINQLCFAFAGFFSGNNILGSVVILRILIILADIGTLYFGKKLLENLGLPIKNIWLYILNPFIIIELTGNLHFEGVMIFFFIWSLYLLQKGSWKWTAVLLAFSVSVKLIPLLFLPLFFQWFAKHKVSEISKITFQTVWKGILKLIAFYSIVIATIIILFLPFLSEQFISNYKETVGLWFQNFEFNASIYYIARWIGFKIVGWNMIKDIGKITPIIVLIFVTGISLFRNNKDFQKMISALLFGLSFYFFTTTTMHPWYLATLLILSVFTNYRFTVVWSFMIIFSYTAYRNESYAENLGFVALEYVVVYGFLIYEIFKQYTKKPGIQTS
ncbi:Alpha-(1-_6)-mannopyranosyltransferase A [Kordia antarctica]|uniref:Alpha-(1->6)-mannopyranosyltransferase A n=1 Tax=Kordia antarctica TaxID=1218801 RepID=A0A7L4ZKL7_9FLAO|nr:mannosyltransferase [Kordia antarctica]QHI37051.1 Alpha-(1->6)-mannopyranosyltransferase A [Kordia antarctica]